MTELSFIASLKHRFGERADVPIGIGDDAAVWRPQQKDILITSDMLLDGKHFTVGKDPARLIGRKSLAVNLSDIAAMGGSAAVATVSLALPRNGLPKNFLREFYDGMAELAEQFNVGIVGGDTNSWEGAFAVSITVLGQAHKAGVVSRRGAMPGDIICVTGPLGGSIEGKHLSFAPRLTEVKTLLDRFLPHAMLDISDGLATDLRHICQASHCGAILFEHSIPLTSQAKLSEDPLRAALCDGEDFELCVVVGEGDWLLWKDQVDAGPLIQIGVIVETPGLFLKDSHGGQRQLQWRGFEHDFIDT